MKDTVSVPGKLSVSKSLIPETKLTINRSFLIVSCLFGKKNIETGN